MKAARHSIIQPFFNRFLLPLSLLPNYFKILLSSAFTGLGAFYGALNRLKDHIFFKTLSRFFYVLYAYLLSFFEYIDTFISKILKYIQSSRWFKAIAAFPPVEAAYKIITIFYKQGYLPTIACIVLMDYTIGTLASLEELSGRACIKSLIFCQDYIAYGPDFIIAVGAYCILALALMRIKSIKKTITIITLKDSSYSLAGKSSSRPASPSLSRQSSQQQFLGDSSDSLTSNSLTSNNIAIVNNDEVRGMQKNISDYYSTFFGLITTFLDAIVGFKTRLAFTPFSKKMRYAIIIVSILVNLSIYFLFNEQSAKLSELSSKSDRAFSRNPNDDTRTRALADTYNKNLFFECFNIASKYISSKLTYVYMVLILELNNKGKIGLSELFQNSSTISKLFANCLPMLGALKSFGTIKANSDGIHPENAVFIDDEHTQSSSILVHIVSSLYLSFLLCTLLYCGLCIAGHIGLYGMIMQSPLTSFIPLPSSMIIRSHPVVSFFSFYAGMIVVAAKIKDILIGRIENTDHSVQIIGIQQVQSSKKFSMISRTLRFITQNYSHLVSLLKSSIGQNQAFAGIFVYFCYHTFFPNTLQWLICTLFVAGCTPFSNNGLFIIASPTIKTVVRLYAALAIPLSTISCLSHKYLIPKPERKAAPEDKDRIISTPSPLPNKRSFRVNLESVPG